MPRRSLLHFCLTLIALCWLPDAFAGECNLSVAELYRKAGPSVVKLTALSIDPFDPASPFALLASSGFVFDKQGFVATNYHGVLRQKTILAEVQGHAPVEAVFVSGDPLLDIALLRLNWPSGDALPDPLFFSDGVPEAGQPVSLLGYPFGQELSVTAGLISADEVVIPRNALSWSVPMVEVDISANPGNSGGPLLDDCGRVIGVMTLRTTSGLAFALPAGPVRSALVELRDKGRVSRPWFGIQGRYLSGGLGSILRIPLVRGFLVETVEPGSDAERAGLRGGSEPVRTIAAGNLLIGGDVLTKVNGVELRSLPDVEKLARSLKPGDDVSFDYFRSGVAGSGSIRLTARPVLPDDIRVLDRRLSAPERSTWPIP